MHVVWGQMVWGGLAVALSVLVQAFFIGSGAALLRAKTDWLTSGRIITKTTLGLVFATLWLLVALGIAVAIWAVVLVFVGAFDDGETALYFSAAAFTTLGFGDVLLAREWRLLSGLMAANGLLLFGLNTAFLIEFMTRMNRAHEALLSKRDPS